MEDTLVVEVLAAFSELVEEDDRVLLLDTVDLLLEGLKVPSLTELHDEVVVVGRFGVVVESHNVRVLQLHPDLHFVEERFQEELLLLLRVLCLHQLLNQLLLLDYFASVHFWVVLEHRDVRVREAALMLSGRVIVG